MDKTSEKLFGLVGYPVKHSFSPAMHNAVLKKYKMTGKYSLFGVKLQELKPFFESLSSKNIYGLNVTVPYKEKILDFVELYEEYGYLKHIKAVNTIVRIKDEWRGFNTDIPGFEIHLKENFNPKNKKVALLGAGGAAKAVTYVLANSGAEEIVIFDIDKGKARKVCSLIKDLFPDFKISTVGSIEKLNIPEKDLLVNATPIGLKKRDPCLVDKNMLHKDLFVYDLIYNPAETKLLSLAKKVGAGFSNGLGMLIYQGALSFVLFTDADASINEIVKVMKRALKKELNK